METAESAIQVVGVGTQRVSGTVAAVQPDRVTPTAHMRNFDTRGYLRTAWM